MLALEYWAFAISSLWAGWLGPTELAAHSIALNLASITYMVPLGIGLGASTRVGNLIGAGEPRAAQRAAWVAFALGGGVMSLFALLFVAGRSIIPAWYTPDLTVIALAATLLPIVAAFELFDGLQVVGSGVLRGMGRTAPGGAVQSDRLLRARSAARRLARPSGAPGAGRHLVGPCPRPRRGRRPVGRLGGLARPGAILVDRSERSSTPKKKGPAIARRPFACRNSAVLRRNQKLYFAPNL